MLRRIPLPMLFALGAVVSMVLAAGAVWQFARPADEMLRALVPAWIGIAGVFWVLWRQVPPPADDAGQSFAPARTLPRDVAPLGLDRRFPEFAATTLPDLEYVVIATEMTGPNPARDALTRVAAMRIQDGRVSADLFDRSIDRESAGAAIEAFLDFAGNAILVGHNCAADLTMLSRTHAIENPVLDTMLLSTGVFPSRDDQSLGALADHFDLDRDTAHTAAGDAELTAGIFLKLWPELDREGARRFGDAQDLCAYAASS